MDKNKPPGISFDNIILKELVFSRKENYSDRPVFDINMDSTISFSPEEDRMIYEMSCEIKDNKDLFSIKCTMIGFFSVIKGQENMGLKEYAELNAPATILPYIREAIASTTTRAGIPPIIIPPTNLNLLKPSKINDNEVSS
jgi:preprotein translocase subunit SecB